MYNKSRSLIILISLAVFLSGYLPDDEREQFSRWHTTTSGVLIRAQLNGATVPPEKCFPPSEVTRHQSYSVSADLCTYKCIKDTDCPYGYACACKDGCFFSSNKGQRKLPESSCISLDLQASQDRLRSKLHRMLESRFYDLPPIETPMPGSCPYGFSEAYGVCVVRCEGDEDCEAGKICIASNCVNRCSKRRPCPKGYECSIVFGKLIPINHRYFDEPHCTVPGSRDSKDRQEQ